MREAKKAGKTRRRGGEDVDAPAGFTAPMPQRLQANVQTAFNEIK